MRGLIEQRGLLSQWEMRRHDTGNRGPIPIINTYRTILSSNSRDWKRRTSFDESKSNNFFARQDFTLYKNPSPWESNLNSQYRSRDIKIHTAVRTPKYTVLSTFFTSTLIHLNPKSDTCHETYSNINSSWGGMNDERSWIESPTIVSRTSPGKREFIGACSRQVHACKIGAVQLYIRSDIRRRAETRQGCETRSIKSTLEEFLTTEETTL